MTPDGKTRLFARLYQSHLPPGRSRGRPPSPFSTDAHGGTAHPLSLSAYARRLHHFKLLAAVDRGLPCMDPVAEVRGRIGSVRRTLWIYLHSCLPSCPERAGELADLLAVHDSGLLAAGIERIILRELAAGRVTDERFAVAVLDDGRLFAFARHWFHRPAGGSRKPGTSGGGADASGLDGGA